MTIGEEIRKLRKEKGFTQKELAARSGVSITYISQVETGISNVSIVLLKDIADALGASRLYLYKIAGFIDDADINQSQGNKNTNDHIKYLKQIANIKIIKNRNASHYHALLLLAVTQAKKALKELSGK